MSFEMNFRCKNCKNKPTKQYLKFPCCIFINDSMITCCDSSPDIHAVSETAINMSFGEGRDVEYKRQVGLGWV